MATETPIVIITGHKGRVGTVLTKAFDRAGMVYFGIDLPEYDLELEDGPWTNLFHNPHTVACIHLAASNRPKGERRRDLNSDFQMRSHRMLVNVVDTMKRAGWAAPARRLIFASSPMAEPLIGKTLTSGKAPEDDRLYGLHKRIDEEAVDRIDGISLRLTGEESDGKLVKMFADALDWSPNGRVQK